ncbi:hypothetical protein OAV21_00555 [bacterium]|nr:hypothetical protein [Verrucomicrobiales bacterium]MDC3254872.1 hypothetical protein [bacterium]
MATGFWNPFNLKFNMQGKLLLVDNDPDTRETNRLLKLTRGGDYGYKSAYGGGGNHPFQGWDGSFSGMLRFIFGTGQAPCDLIDCCPTQFPTDYHSSVLATIWSENTIERHALKEDWQDPSATRKGGLFSGNQNFRPVAMEADSRVNLFIADWVLVDYPNHGRGRLWRVHAKEGKKKPRGYFDYGEIDETLAEQLIGDSEEPRIRQLLMDRRAGNIDNLPNYLSDSDPAVKRAALVWAGEHLEPKWRDSLDLSLKGRTSRLMFAAYLAAFENLSNTLAEESKNKRKGKAKVLKRLLDPSVLVGIMKNAVYSDDIRALALERLDRTLVIHERP